MSTVPKWDYQTANIQGDINKQNYNRADRTVLFASNGEATAQFKPVGFIQGFSHMEQKQIQVIFELGSANPMIVPGLTTGQLSISRVLLNGYDFLNAVINGPDAKLDVNNILRSIRDTNKPFDLMIARYQVMEDGNASVPAQAMNTAVFKGCHIQSKSEQISAGGVVTLEQVSLYYQSIPKVTFNTIQ
jgi:hypothetical protein